MCPALNGHSAQGPTLLDRSHRVALDSLAFYLSGGGRIVCPMLILLVFLILCILLFGASAVLGVLGGVLSVLVVCVVGFLAWGWISELWAHPDYWWTVPALLMFAVALFWADARFGLSQPPK